jgi:tRNA-modifying protein YgfZ
MTGSIAVLPDRGIVAVEGAEAADFLHALLTCDVKALAPGQGAYGALLTPQGKILFDLFTWQPRPGFMLDAAASSADDLAKRLMMYRLRRKIEIARRPDLGIAAIWDCERRRTSTKRSCFATPRGGIPRLPGHWPPVAARGRRHGRCRPLSCPSHGARHRRFGPRHQIGPAFPHEANLDQLHGVSFSKGCYVGQEVVSRMEHRGTARSRIVPVRFDGPPPAPGTGVAAGGRSLGTVLSSLDGRGLAIVRLDRAEAALAAASRSSPGRRRWCWKGPSGPGSRCPARRRCDGDRLGTLAHRP